MKLAFFLMILILLMQTSATGFQVNPYNLDNSQESGAQSRVSSDSMLRNINVDQLKKQSRNSGEETEWIQTTGAIIVAIIGVIVAIFGSVIGFIRGGSVILGALIGAFVGIIIGSGSAITGVIIGAIVRVIGAIAEGGISEGEATIIAAIIYALGLIVAAIVGVTGTIVVARIKSRQPPPLR